MAVVFELLNEDGTVRLDLTKRLFRVLKVVDVSTSNSSTSVTGLDQGDMLVLFPAVADRATPTFSKSGSTVSWTHDPSVPTSQRATGKAKIAVY